MSNCPPVTPAGCVYNFTPGRPGPVTAIYLHGAPGPLEYLDEQHKSRITPPPSGYATAPKHSSFHFAVGTVGEIHSFVDVADTAWAFGVSNPTLDPTSINIVLPVGFKLSQNACLPGSQWSKDQFNSLVNEICCLLQQFNLTIDAIHLAPGELDNYPLDALKVSADVCLASSEAPYPIGTAACLPPHASSADLTLPVTAWRGNCLVALTVPGVQEVCQMTIGPAEAVDRTVTNVVVDGVSYPAPGSGIPMDQISMLSTWLNGLGLGEWNVFLTAPDNVATVEVILNATPAQSVSFFTSTGVMLAVRSGCVTRPSQVPVTVQDTLAQPSITYASGVISVNGVPLVNGAAIYDMGGTLLGYAMPV